MFISVQDLQTAHLLELSSWHGLDALFLYPFDQYRLSTTLNATSPDTNASLPVLSLHIMDTTSSFSPTELSNIVTRTKSGVGSSRTTDVLLVRTRFTQAFVMTLLIVNWALTAVVVWITVSAFTGVEVDESVLMLPLSVVLTIPALHAMWVGAPAFGKSGLISVYHRVGDHSL